MSRKGYEGNNDRFTEETSFFFVPGESIGGRSVRVRALLDSSSFLVADAEAIARTGCCRDPRVVFSVFVSWIPDPEIINHVRSPGRAEISRLPTQKTAKRS